MFWLNPPLVVSLPMDVVSFTDQRARIQPQIDFVERASLDQYTFTRDLYLRYRAAQIGGEIPEEEDLYGTGEESLQKEEPPAKPPAATDYLR